MQWFLRFYPPPLDIADWRHWKLTHQKRPPIDPELVRELFEEHYTEMFEDPRTPEERDYPGAAGILIEVPYDGRWYRIAFELDDENWKAKLYTCVVTQNPRFIGRETIEYIYKR